MAYFWSTWLADALRADPVLAPLVVEVAGWQTRGRPPSQFSYLPSGVLDHHTACMCNVGHDPQSCINGILHGNSSAPGPIAQLLTSFTPAGVRWNGSNVDPRVYVIAAGRCNHAGAGRYRWGAPAGNGSSIGQETCGPPGVWPDRVVEIKARVSAAILRHNGWPLDHDTTHNEYVAPVRPGAKIDPSGPWHRQPNLARLAPWNPDLWRTEIGRYMLAPAPKPPTPPAQLPILKPEDDDMASLTVQANNGTPTQQQHAFWWDGKKIGWIPTVNQFNVGKFVGLYSTGSDGNPVKNFTAGEIQAMIDTGWAGGVVPEGFNAPSS